MEGVKNNSVRYYKDVPLFIILVPLINAINYYLTYSPIILSAHTLLTFTIDTLQGYLAWWSIRTVILYLDRKLPYSPKPLKRIGIQILLTTLAAIGLIIITTEIINAIAKDTPVPSSFYRFDIFIFVIWFFVINGIYIALHYYSLWRESERLRQDEKKVRQSGFLVKKGKQSLYLSFSEIAGIYVEKEYAMLITLKAEKYLLDQSLDKAEKSLPPEQFFRLNRKYIINRSLISGYERAENAKINVLLNSSSNLPSSIQMSRLKAPAFKNWFEHQNQ